MGDSQYHRQHYFTYHGLPSVAGYIRQSGDYYLFPPPEISGVQGSERVKLTKQSSMHSSYYRWQPVNKPYLRSSAATTGDNQLTSPTCVPTCSLLLLTQHLRSINLLLTYYYRWRARSLRVFVSDIAILVLKRDVKLQPSNCLRASLECRHSSDHVKSDP